MSALDEILAQPNGAQFFRADLHIHSHGASHDVKDAGMTPTAIVHTAADKGIAVVALTDHNEISGVESAIKASRGTSILVIAGVELSTSQGHLLCYLPDLDALRQFHGKLSIVGRGGQDSRCQQSILECLNLLALHGGFGVLAHVDIQSGFETDNPGSSPHKVDVLCHSALLGIELKHASSSISYSDSDADPQRAQIGQTRIKRLNLGSKQFLARVLNSDAHALSALGRNAASADRITRYKMDVPSFEALRLAYEDADARVRLEDQIPKAIPKILGVHIDGGFLSGQVVRFSSNLNCIIGGRGTGKSTIFESVRCIVGEPSDSKVVDSEVWPDDLHLVWEDQAGQRHLLQRLKECSIDNLDDIISGPDRFDIDCFGQGEAARISIEAQNDPLALLRYLDKFVDLTEAIALENEHRDKLLELQTEIEKTERSVALIPQYERQLSTTEQQLTALRKPEVKELIDLQSQLAKERKVRSQILDKLEQAKKSIKLGSPKGAIKEIRDIAEPDLLSVGSTEYRTILEGTAAFESIVGTAEAQINSGLSQFETLVSTQLKYWKAKDQEANKKIDAKRKELEAMKVSFDMSYITKLAKDQAEHEQTLKSLRLAKPILEGLRKERAGVLKERWRVRERVATLRDAFGRQASETLKQALSDLAVSLKYKRNSYSPEASNQIITAMGWRTNQQPRAAWLVETLTVPILLNAIQAQDIQPILDIRTPENTAVFAADEARLIIERLSDPTIRYALERATIHDLPRLQVSRAVSDGAGGKRFLVREFAKLSLGQQQSVLLALVLSSNSNRPLIIDQPEDNLDGEFIYSTLVPVLRMAKERRQIIVVTHNSNVAVLGDAELIVVMKAFSDRGEIVARGSIDSTKTRDLACSILEGAKEAFLRRAKMYGIRLRDVM